MGSKKVAIAENTKLIEVSQFTKEDVRKYFCEGATDKEIVRFLNVANMFNLNPLKREIYLVKYGNQPAQMLTGYEVYLKRAERSNKWNGFEVTTAGNAKEGNMRAICKVWRKDWEHPLVHEAYFDEYVQRKKDGTVNKFWKEKPRTMIKKVAISQAFRLAFPDDLGGMPYTADEMNTIDVTAEKESIIIPKEEAEIENIASETPKKEGFVPQEINDAELVAPKDELTEKSLKTAVEPISEPIQPAGDISVEQVTQIKDLTMKNGYTYPEVLEIIGTLGYKKVKKVSTLDFPTIIKEFEFPATDYRRRKEQLKKEWDGE